jgi:hypothetical protein
MLLQVMRLFLLDCFFLLALQADAGLGLLYCSDLNFTALLGGGKYGS